MEEQKRRNNVKGTVSVIPTYAGVNEVLRVLCSFSYEGRKYVLAIDGDGNNVCRQIKWTLARGTYQSSEPVNEKIRDIAQALSDRAKEKKEFFNFEAEHYEIRREKGTIRVKKNGSLRILSPYARCAPDALRLIFVLTLALVFGFMYIHSSDIYAASALFGDLPAAVLYAVIYLIQIAGSSALFFYRKDSRGTIDLVFNAFVPYTVLSLAAAVIFNTRIRIVMICLASVMFFIGILPKMVQTMKARGSAHKAHLAKEVFGRCVSTVFLCAYTVFIISHLFGMSLFTYTGESIEAAPCAEVTDESFLEAKQSLRSGVWDGYDGQQKIDKLQIICNYECKNVLGCEPPAVTAEKTVRDTLYGAYESETGTIIINKELLENGTSAEVLNTLLHETRHAYQHAVKNAYEAIEESLGDDVKELLCFKLAGIYRDEFENYIGADKDFNAYYEQTVERDSREWAESRLETEYGEYVFQTQE